MYRSTLSWIHTEIPDGHINKIFIDGFTTNIINFRWRNTYTYTHMQRRIRCSMHNSSLTTKCGMDCWLYVYEGQMEIQMQKMCEAIVLYVNCLYISKMLACLHCVRFEKKRRAKQQWARDVCDSYFVAERNRMKLRVQEDRVNCNK